jgi:hypothetical protein
MACVRLDDFYVMLGVTFYTKQRYAIVIKQ